MALVAFALAFGLVSLVGTPDADAVQKEKKKRKAREKASNPFPGKEPPATDPATMKIAKGFKVELLYSVPKNEQGSWVSMCTDPKGRLIVSDQYGSLYRITPPPIGGPASGTKVEKLPTAIGMAQGLLWAFDALYVVVNSKDAGIYRVTDPDGDDIPDKVELLRKFEGGGGEHGPHAVIPHPDGKRLTVVCGNQTKLTKFDTTRVPPVWGDDHLLPRLPDGNGFMAGVLGPGGAIYNITPDGERWELVSVGYRNEYDAAYNKAGDLFTYDADMEWDFNTPWYRPTRVCLAASGSDYGWRNGTGKYPPYYPDTLPAIVDIGPGSPTGVCFGYGAKFPQKYQDAFFICDWSYGKLYAVHLSPEGSAYKGEFEEFVTGTPLPLTDLVINPKDGAMYFAIGGRRTKSGLYRVTYTGEESTAPSEAKPKPPTDLQRLRLRFDREMGGRYDQLSSAALRLLDHEDRTVRYLARTTLEHQHLSHWGTDRIAELERPAQEIARMLALTRVSVPCPLHAKPDSPKPTPQLRALILGKLNEIPLDKLNAWQKIDLARTYQVALHRLGEPTADERKAILAKFAPAFPSEDRSLNGMLLEILVYLQDHTVAPKAMKLLGEAPTQEEQIDYAKSLRMLKTGWTPELRKEYFTWFLKAANYRGGSSFGGFLRLIKTDAVKTLSDAEATALKDVIEAKPGAAALPEEKPRPFVKAWKVNDLAPKLEAGLKSGRDFDNGRKLFAVAKCFSCHRYDNEGGSYGPDLTGVAGRFSPRDLLESVVDPNKEISDQYAQVEIRTLDGRIVVGRIVNLSNDDVRVNTNMLDPGSTTAVNRNNIESMKPSKISMMPAGLLDTFKEDEILDLMAYMLSRGDRTAATFKK
jgi:putative heme-binding domain-containing protein